MIKKLIEAAKKDIFLTAGISAVNPLSAMMWKHACSKEYVLTFSFNWMWEAHDSCLSYCLVVILG